MNKKSIYSFTELARGRFSLLVPMSICVCMCLFVPKVVIVNYAQMVRALFRDIMNLLNLEGHKSYMIGSIVTAIFTHFIYFPLIYKSQKSNQLITKIFLKEKQ